MITISAHQPLRPVGLRVVAAGALIPLLAQCSDASAERTPASPWSSATTASTGSTATAPGAPKAPRAPGGPAWTTRIRAHPVLDRSSARTIRLLRKGAVADMYEYGVPVFSANAKTRKYHVRCTEHWGPCPLARQPVPIPASAAPAPGTDGAMVVVDSSTGRNFEFWQARRVRGSWVASWGEVTRVSGRTRRGATGAGIPLLNGLVRLGDIRAGRIDHALAFASEYACKGVYRSPASKTDGTRRAKPCIPEGARLQLDPRVDVGAIPGMSPAERMVAVALQRYGAYCRDVAGAPMAIGFENPAGKANPYPGAGLAWDYFAFTHIPWSHMRLLRSWSGT